MLYSEKVMDHFRHPRNVGILEHPDGVGEVGNAKCGDIMKIYLKIDQDTVSDVKFETFGCGSAIASSSMATEMIKGKSLDEVMDITNKAVAEALRFSMEQEAEGIRAKGLAEAEAIEKKAEAQKRMGEASILEMYLAALPEVVKNAAAPLSQTEKIVMYGDGNSTKLVRDIIASANQVADGMRESTGIDLQALIAGFAGGKAAREAEIG